MRPARSKSSPEPRVTGILGVGLDGTDGHTRVTRSEEMVVVGGSAETHERMQETAVRFSEALQQRGKVLAEVSARDAIAMLKEAAAKGR